MVRTLSILCGDCGARLKEYELYDRETGETTGTHEVCPNEWRANHA